jgi:hypothetical protein
MFIDARIGGAPRLYLRVLTLNSRIGASGATRSADLDFPAALACTGERCPIVEKGPYLLA